MQAPHALRIGAALLIALIAQSAAATSYSTPPYDRFDATEYVLYGEVTGYTSLPPESGCNDEIVTLKRCGWSWGVVLRVLDSVHMPREVGSVDLFSPELQPSCEGHDEECIRRIPVGSRFKVAAQVLDDTQRLTLVTRIWMRGAVVPIAKDQSIAKLAGARYHYMSGDLRSDLWNEAYFELRKDMLRLERAKTENDALEVLLRLAGNARLLEGTQDIPESGSSVFDALVERHLKSPRSRRALEQRLRMVSYWSGDEQVEADLAASGYTTAMFMQAKRLVKRDDEDGVRQLRRMAGKGFHPAMLEMALYHEERDESTQASSLFAQLRRVTLNAEREHDVAGLFLLSKFYQEGIGGLPENPEEATRLACLGRAAAQTDPHFPDLVVQWAEMLAICYGN